MTDKLVIAVLAGTTRVQRQSHHAARLIADYGRARPELDIILVDPLDFHFPGDGNDPEGKDPRYTDITVKADGFFIVTPEYNHGYPGSLKRMLDSELANYFHKPVAFAGASNGNWGGVRAIEALVCSVREMGMVATSYDVQFPYVQNLFDEQGKLKAEYQDRYDRTVGKAFDELIWFARLLKSAR
jgi:NAD(P)H-dependent FMN reductase